MTEMRDETPTVRLQTWEHAPDGGILSSDQFATVLAGYLPRQRWYGDKGRTIAGFEIADAATVAINGDRLLLTVVDVTFAQGDERSRYFVPLALVVAAPSHARPLARVAIDDASFVLIDALDDGRFPSWFLDQLASGRELPTVHGRFAWHRQPSFADLLPRARDQPATIGGAEQSNSAIRYGSALFVKLFRRLRGGENPDEEIGRYLSTRTTYRRSPRPAGGAAYIDRAGNAFPIALVQEFVASEGDAWSFALQRLAELAAAPAAGGGPVPEPVGARLLGERTGELHRALAAETDDPAFAPETIDEGDARDWERRAISALAAIIDELRQRQPDLPPRLRERIAVFLRQQSALEARAHGFHRQRGQVKTRVHGDYHLGQVLRAPDADWIIIDFEGEPARTIAERRAKTSPLKDVAGMLRSLSYARGAALRAVQNDAVRAAAAPRLTAWETVARDAFLAGYLDQIRQSPMPVVPDDRQSFDEAVAAWELDKAIYEIGYELGNRPDWLDLPLGALIGGDDTAPSTHPPG